MKLDGFTNNFKTMKQENFWSRIIGVGLVACLFVTISALTNKKAVVTLMPPNLTEAAELHHNKAQEQIHKAWSLYLAQNIGNVTPGTSEFLIATFDQLLSPSIYDQTIVLLEKQIDQIKRDGISFSFEPREVLYEIANGKTYVTGRHYMHTSPTDYERTTRTYEFVWEFKNYLPRLTFIETYEGAPKVKVR